MVYYLEKVEPYTLHITIGYTSIVIKSKYALKLRPEIADRLNFR